MGSQHMHTDIPHGGHSQLDDRLLTSWVYNTCTIDTPHGGHSQLKLDDRLSTPWVYNTCTGIFLGKNARGDIEAF